MNFHDNSKDKNRKIDFSFVSDHSASFMKTGAKLHILKILEMLRNVYPEKKNYNWKKIRLTKKAFFQEPGSETSHRYLRKTARLWGKIPNASEASSALKQRTTE